MNPGDEGGGFSADHAVTHWSTHQIR